MISRGNLIVNFRKSELQQLEDILSRLPAHKVKSTALDSGSGLHQQNVHHDQQQQQQRPHSPTDAKNHIESDEIQPRSMVNQEDVFLDTDTISQVATLPDALSTAQLMALADSIEAVDAEWITNAALDTQCW